MTLRPGLTFDTGALIALERHTQRAWHIYRLAVVEAVPITVPTGVIAEWWRGRTDIREGILGGVRVEPLSLKLAQAAGAAMAVVKRATLVDALVMASAAARGDIVYTSDIDGLERLRAYFPAVRVLHI